MQLPDNGRGYANRSEVRWCYTNVLFRLLGYSVLLVSSSGRDPSLTKIMLKKRAFTLVETVLHCLDVITSTRDAEFSGHLTACVSSHATVYYTY